MNNNNKNLMSIGIIAKSLNITRKIILNYENLGLIKPDVKDGSTGNRYYTADTLTKIRSIRVLQNCGLSLAEINAYFDEAADIKPIIKRLETMRNTINLNIEKLREREKRTTNNEIEKAVLPQQTLYCKTIFSKSIEQRTAFLREIFLEALRLYGSDTSKRMFFIEYSIDNPDKITYCIAVPQGSKGENIYVVAETQALCIYYHGAYEDLPEIRSKIIDYANNNQIKLQGKCRHIYLEGPPQRSDKSKYITQMCVII